MAKAAKQPNPLAHGLSQFPTPCQAFERSFHTSCGLQLWARLGAAGASVSVAARSVTLTDHAIRRPVAMDSPRNCNRQVSCCDKLRRIPRTVHGIIATDAIQARSTMLSYRAGALTGKPPLTTREAS